MKKKFLIGILNSLVLRILIRLANFITFLLVVNKLDESISSSFFILISFFNISSTSCLKGFQDTLIRTTARKQNGFVFPALKYNFLGSLLGSLLLFLFFFFNENLNSQIKYGILALAIFNPLINGLISWKSIMLGKEKVIQLTFLDFLSSILVNLTLIISILFFKPSALDLIIVFLIFPSLINIIKSFSLIRQLFKIEKKNYSYINEKKFSIVSSAISLFPAIAKEIDRLLVYSIINPINIIILNIVTKLPDILKDFFRIFVTFFFPRMSKQKKYNKKLKDIFFKTNLFNLISITIFTFFIYPIIFKLLFKENFHEFIFQSQILLLSIIFANDVILKNFFFKSQLDTRSYFISSLSGPIIKIALSVILIYNFGINGAIASIVIQRIISSLINEKLIR